MIVLAMVIRCSRIGEGSLDHALVADDLVGLEAGAGDGEVELLAGRDGEGDLGGAGRRELEADAALAGGGGDGGGELQGELEGALLVGDEGVVVVLDHDRGLDVADLGRLEGDGRGEDGDAGPAAGLEVLGHDVEAGGQLQDQLSAVGGLEVDADAALGQVVAQERRADLPSLGIRHGRQRRPSHVTPSG